MKTSLFLLTDTKPFIPDGWKLITHRQYSELFFNPSKLGIYFSELQIGKKINGHKLYEELKTKKILNANFLDYLIAHPENIPEEYWERKRTTHFWGTLYLDKDGFLSVRHLSYNGNRTDWDYNRLDYPFDSDNPAAVLIGVPLVL